MYSRSKRLVRIVVSILALTTCKSAWSIVLDWEGNLDANWASSANWSPAQTPTNGDALVFAGTTQTSTSNDLIIDTLIEGILFSNTGNGQNFTLSGNRILLNEDIRTTLVASAANDLIEDEIALDIVLNTAGIGINTGTGHNVRVTGNISGAQELEINNGNGSQDDGRVTLAGQNSHASTRLMGGTLVILNNTALGSGAFIIEDRSNNDPVLELGSDGLNLSNDISVTNQGRNKTIRFDLAGTNAATLSGNLFLDETTAGNRFEIGENEILTLAGQISGRGGINLRREGGSGTLVVSGDNINSGNNIIEQGTLVLESSTALGTGRLDIENRGTSAATDPVLELLPGLNIANTIRIRNSGGNKTIRFDRPGSNQTELSGPITLQESTRGNFDVDVGLEDRLEISGVIGSNGAAGVNKIGLGILVLSGANTNDRGIVVAEGTLEVNGDSSRASGVVEVDPGAVIQGSGRIGGDLNLSGELSPGEAGIGSFTVRDADFEDGSSFNFEFDSSAPAATFADVLVATRDLSLNGSINLGLTDTAAASGPLAVGTVVTLVNYNRNYNGGLFSYNGITLAEGDEFNAGLNRFQINYESTTFGDNFGDDQTSDTAVTLTAVVPENSAFAFLVGLIALTLVGNRRPRR
ncbi:MAG: autotransporter-associated beta strand repeat-containing protein [Verrucomicrobiota bacterium]